jgi:glucose-1-phosphate cytidylyltransferase
VKVVILAGGLGSRFAEETEVRPKPMIEIGGFPILWHIMKIYAHFGLTEFVICLGYKGYVIKEYFANYFLHASDVTIDLRSNQLRVHAVAAEPWTVTLIDTGAKTMTGGRLKRVRDYLGGETFCFTYGDGIGDIPIDRLLAFHREHGRSATVTAVQPPARFGAVEIADDRVVAFHEKPFGGGGFINGGFFVLEPDVIERIGDDSTVWEESPLESLAADGQLAAFTHTGFWHPMDTQRDRTFLEQLWKEDRAPWKLWS